MNTMENDYIVRIKKYNEGKLEHEEEHNRQIRKISDQIIKNADLTENKESSDKSDDER